MLLLPFAEYLWIARSEELDTNQLETDVFTEADYRVSAQAIGSTQLALCWIVLILFIIMDIPKYRRDYKIIFIPSTRDFIYTVTGL